MEDIRERMIEDMKLRGLTPGTQATYLEAVKVLARHCNSRLDENARIFAIVFHCENRKMPLRGKNNSHFKMGPEVRPKE